MHFTRFGIYYTPADQEFADAGASWLGWDIRTALARNAPCPDHVARPAKYGFHGTLKPPFRLAANTSQNELEAAIEQLATKLPIVTLDALSLSQIGSFLAFTPEGDQKPLRDFAAKIVRDLDRFRAPPTDAERTKRLRPNMPEQEKRNLADWGYPYVMESFRFHMTLTGPLTKSVRDACRKAATAHFAQKVPKPLAIDSVTLVGEREDGMFLEVRRFASGKV